jgi:hypothetical protein
MVRKGVLTVDAVNVTPEPPRLTNKAVGASPTIIKRPTTAWLIFGAAVWVQGVTMKSVQI